LTLRLKFPGTILALLLDQNEHNLQASLENSQFLPLLSISESLWYRLSRLIFQDVSYPSLEQWFFGKTPFKLEFSE